MPLASKPGAPRPDGKQDQAAGNYRSKPGPSSSAFKLSPASIACDPYSTVRRPERSFEKKRSKYNML